MTVENVCLVFVASIMVVVWMTAPSVATRHYQQMLFRFLGAMMTTPDLEYTHGVGSKVVRWAPKFPGKVLMNMNGICTEVQKIEKGDTVEVHYQGKITGFYSDDTFDVEAKDVDELTFPAKVLTLVKKAPPAEPGVGTLMRANPFGGHYLRKKDGWHYFDISAGELGSGPYKWSDFNHGGVQIYKSQPLITS